MDNIDEIALLEGELDMLICKAHNEGLSYWHILRVILSRLQSLVMQSDVEYWLKQL